MFSGFLVHAHKRTEPTMKIAKNKAKNCFLPTLARILGHKKTKKIPGIEPINEIEPGAAVKIMDRFFRHRKVPLHRKIFKTQISA